MSKVIVFSNQKGGVGKTTCTRELGFYLSTLGFMVCMIDADPQANLTKSLTDTTSTGLYEALTEQEWEYERISETLLLVAGNIRCAGLERSLVAEIDCYTRMKDMLQDFSFNSFDFILIDSPPSLGILTINALTSADYLIIPMNPSQYSMHGTNDLLVTVGKIKKTLNPDLKIAGVIINEYDKNPVIVREITKEIEDAFGEAVFSTRISKAIALEEVIAMKKGIIGRKSKSAEEIGSFGDEFLVRLEKEVHYDL
jgi:chromosome partitioning protein